MPAMTPREAGALLATTTRVRAPALLPELRLHLADEITPLWELLEERAGCEVPPPFWAFAWAGGIALARLFLDSPALVRGRGVLDFAAGCGVAGIAAARAGAARVAVVDVDPVAQVAARANARLNGVDLDTRNDDLVGERLPSWIGLVAVGDVCYEQPLAGRVERWLRGLVAEGREVLLGDPGRAYVPRTGRERVVETVVPTTRELESTDERVTTVWRLR
jgi:predicted nicotinamide N-methyase